MSIMKITVSEYSVIKSYWVKRGGIFLQKTPWEISISTANWVMSGVSILRLQKIVIAKEAIYLNHCGGTNVCTLISFASSLFHN